MVAKKSRIKYWLQNESARADDLLREVRRDPFIASIVNTLDPYGMKLSFRFFGNPGLYRPYAVSMSSMNQGALRDFLSIQNLSVHLSQRFGFAHNLHMLIHEMIHLEQDRRGMFFTPLVDQSRSIVMPDLSSAISIRLFCEAMAEVEAIRASWRLYKDGYGEAWRGALASPDWGVLTRLYADKMSEKSQSETEIAKIILTAWFDLPARAHYERQAVLDHKQFIERLSHKPQFCEMPLSSAIEFLPEQLKDVYGGFEMLDHSANEAIDRFNVAHRSQILTSSQSKKALKSYAQGSPLYMWSQANDN